MALNTLTRTFMTIKTRTKTKNLLEEKKMEVGGGGGEQSNIKILPVKTAWERR